MSGAHKTAPSRLQLCVVGGGIAGLACALRLAADGHRVTLLAGDAVDPTDAATTVPDETRFYALSPASVQMLRDVGASSGLDGATSYRAMCVWGGALRDALRLDVGDVDDAASLGLDGLGVIAGHGAIASALRERAAASVQVLPVRAVGVTERADGVEIDTSDGDLHTADLVIAADGAASPLRTRAGIDWAGWDYEQLGIVCNVRCDAPLAATAWQRFLPEGPLALLPTGEDSASIVWSADQARAEALLGMDDAAFSAALSEAAQHTPGRLQVTGPRQAFALRAGQAAHYAQGRLVLVGDSAHVIHPLAGQGLNLGLQDVAALAAALEDAGDAGQRTRALRRYSRRRRAATADMMAVTDGLYRLFGPAGPEFAEWRDAGMALVGRLAPARAWLVARALGLPAETD